MTRSVFALICAAATDCIIRFSDCIINVLSCCPPCVCTIDKPNSMKSQFSDFHPHFLSFSCAENMPSFLIQSECQRLTPIATLCKQISSFLLAVTCVVFKQMLNSSMFSHCEALRRLVSMYDVRQKRGQRASKVTKFNKTSLFHEHQSFKTSSSIYLFFYPSMTTAVLLSLHSRIHSK